MSMTLTSGMVKWTGRAVTLHPYSQYRNTAMGGDISCMHRGAEFSSKRELALTRRAQPFTILGFSAGARRSYQQLKVFDSLGFSFPYSHQGSLYLLLRRELSKENTWSILTEQESPAGKHFHQRHCET